ncbi:MAG TPA: PAS domain-containing protein [Candidatus Sulfotelmatobacter sp.]|nr:PAS domain-containing protein [Candidatus Sulfotelmatobacter sp.]
MGSNAPFSQSMSNSDHNPRKDSPQEHENRLSRIIESAHLGTWDWNIETGELVWSRECLEMFGLSPDAPMSYELFLQAIYPEDRERVNQAVQAAIETGEEYSTEMRSVWPDGSMHWIASRGRVYFDKSGKPVRMSGAGMEVTPFKETEDELEQARAETKAHSDNLAAVLDAIPAITFFSRDREGRTMTAGREAREVFGLPENTNVSLSDPEVRERFNFEWLEDGRVLAPEELPVQQAASTGKAVAGRKFEVRFPDGRSLYLLGHAVPLLDTSGQSHGAVGAFLDITQLKNAEAELQRARVEAKAQADNLSAILEAMPAAAFIAYDRKCENVVGNKAAYALLRMPNGGNPSVTAPEGERPNIVILENGREVPPEELPLQKAAATGQAVRDKEMEIRFADGSSIFEYGHSVPLFDEAGNVRGAIGAYLDVTDRKVVEQRLRITSERFKVALRGTPITVFNQDLDLRYTWIYNPIGAHTVAEIIGKTDLEILEREEDARAIVTIKREVLRTGVSFQGEMQAMMNGAMRHYHATIDPQRDPQGRIVGLTCASFDLTERKQDDAERDRLATQRQLALDAAKMGWWRFDAATNLSKWDDTFKHIYGLSENQGSSQLVIDRVHPEDRDKAVARFRSAMDPADPKPYFNQYRVLLPDGSVRWVESHGIGEFEGEGRARRALGCSGTVQDITERKKADTQLQQNQEAFAKLVENAPYGVYVIDSQFRVALTDPGSRTEAFRNVDPLDGRDFGEVMRILWPEPLASEIIAIFRQTLETGEPYYSHRFRNLRKDLGDVKAYEWETHRIVLPDGQYGVVCYYFDSTEMRNTEDALLRQGERAEFVSEVSDVGFWFCDLPFDKLVWDKRVRRHFWLPADDSPVTIEMFYSMLHPDDREPTRRAIEISIAKNEQYEVEYRTMAPDGRQRWVRAIGRASYDESGKPVRFDGITQDITARKQIEEALKASEARYRTLFETMTDGFALCELLRDKSGRAVDIRWIECNSALERLTGLSRDAVVGHCASEVFPEEYEWWVRKYEHVVRDKAVQRFERGSASAAREWELTAFPYEGDKFAVLYEDITIRKQAEDALRASEARYRDLAGTLEQQVQERTRELQLRNEEVLRTSEELRVLSSRLLQVQDEERRRIARDLHDSSGQILTAIGLDVANIVEQARAEKIRAIAPQLLAQAEESQKLVDLLHRELRTTSYLLHPPLLDEAGLSSAINWYVQGMVQRSGAQIEFDFPENFGRVPREMELLIFRLVQESLTNIHRHSGSKKARIRISRGVDAVTIDIQDWGKGIPPEKLAEIQAGATGLGIRAMRERLMQFGGELRIESAEGGTRVMVTVPFEPSDSPRSGGLDRVEATIGKD